MFETMRRAYLSFRKSHARLINCAKREMDTDMQRGVIDGIAATAFQAGFRAGHSKQDKPIPPPKLRPWTLPKPKTDEPPATP